MCTRRLLPVLLLVSTFAISYATKIKVNGDVIVVNEIPVVHVLANAGDASPSAQCARIALDLQSLDASLEIRAVPHGPIAMIRVDGANIITISTREARLHRSTPIGLARVWAKQIARAAKLPPVKASDNELNLRVDSVQTLKLVGSMVAQCTMNSDNSLVATVEKYQSSCLIHALSPGHTEVRISAGGSNEIVHVDVKNLAASLPQALSAFVTGAPATVSTVRGAVRNAIKTQLAAVPGAQWRFSPPLVSSLGPGESRTFEVPVTITAPETFEARGLVKVVVRNLGLGQASDGDLWYSNDPESVTHPGPLFSSVLMQNRPVRMLYHHLNASSQPMFLRLQAINDSPETARLVIIPGDAKPDHNPVRAGLRAADQFVREWMYGSGEVVSIPPHCTIPISLRRLGPGETLSGLCSLRLVSGPPDIQVRTDAWPPFPIDRQWEPALRTSTPWREVGAHPINEFDRAPSQPSDRIYPSPYREEGVAYQVGGRYGFVRIGQSPIAQQDNSQRLDGNFGVIYRVKAELRNPTRFTTDVELVLEASAGYVGGLFIVNGNYLLTPLLMPKQESRIARYRLAPGAIRTVDITTLPISGGSYPVTLTFRPVQSRTSMLLR